MHPIAPAAGERCDAQGEPGHTHAHGADEPRQPNRPPRAERRGPGAQIARAIAVAMFAVANCGTRFGFGGAGRSWRVCRSWSWRRSTASGRTGGGKWRWTTQRWVSAAIGLFAVSWAFSLHGVRFANPGGAYGSLGAVVAVMLWRWLSVIVGADIKAEAEHQRVADSTKDRDCPVGARGAVMADNVASG